MASKLPHVSRLVTKLLELAGAGAASAAGAFLFSQIAQPALPSQPALPPVQVVPASTELVQVMRKENALLIEQILKDDGHRRDAEVIVPRAAPTPAPKPIKTATARKEPKPERATTAESKARLEELQLPASRTVVNIAAHPDVREAGRGGFEFRRDGSAGAGASPAIAGLRLVRVAGGGVGCAAAAHARRGFATSRDVGKKGLVRGCFAALSAQERPRQAPRGARSRAGRGRPTGAGSDCRAGPFPVGEFSPSCARGLSPVSSVELLVAGLTC